MTWLLFKACSGEFDLDSAIFCKLYRIITIYNDQSAFTALQQSAKPMKQFFTKLSHMINVQKMKRNRKTMFFLGSSLFYLGAISLYIGTTERGSESINSLISKTTDYLSTITVPSSLRNFVYGRYASRYGVDLEEMNKSLAQYPNFSQFFTRTIKKRDYIDEQSKNLKSIASPCDGQILTISKITGDSNVIIKDITYSLNSLLFEGTSNTMLKDIIERLKLNKETQLYQVILYLNPGNYHRFHAPYDIIVQSVRKVEGLLKPVNVKSIMKNGGLVYERNARRVMHCTYMTPGSQSFKYLGMVMIGALNVGNIAISEKPIFNKCQEVGYFNLGSTIVLLLELSPDAKWNKKAGEKVKFGQRLCEFN